jgi:hypothetical protein
MQNSEAKKKKTLVLKKQVLVTLTDLQLQAVAGGMLGASDPSGTNPVMAADL